MSKTTGNSGNYGDDAILRLFGLQEADIPRWTGGGLDNPEITSYDEHFNVIEGEVVQELVQALPTPNPTPTAAPSQPQPSRGFFTPAPHSYQPQPTYQDDHSYKHSETERRARQTSCEVYQEEYTPGYGRVILVLMLLLGSAFILSVFINGALQFIGG
jgi:hypothetical protein